MRGRVVCVRIFTLVLALATVVPVAAEAGTPAPQQRATRGDGRGEAASVADAERVFDRYMLAQARRVLQLTPDQMTRFTQRFGRLQMLQRQRQRQRQRRINELNALGRATSGVDDAAVGRMLDALDRDVAAADEQVRAARVGLDEVLSVRQRARYRAFEARMEREKLQLIARARAEARAQANDAPAADDTGALE